MERIIFNNIDGYDEHTAKDFLMESMQVPEENIDNYLNDEEWLMKTLGDMQEMDFADAKLNLATKLDTNILIIADLGFWNGRQSGYKLLDNNIASILTAFGNDCEYIKIWVEGRNTYGKGVHHDGTHYLEFRKWKPDVSEDQQQKLIDAIYYEQDDMEKLKRKYTTNIADDIKNIYGF